MTRAPFVPLLLVVASCASEAPRSSGRSGLTPGELYAQLLERHEQAAALLLEGTARTTTTTHFGAGPQSISQDWRFRIALDRHGRGGSTVQEIEDGQPVGSPAVTRGFEPGWLLDDARFLLPFFGDRFQVYEPEQVTALLGSSHSEADVSLRARYVFRPSGWLTAEGEEVPFDAGAEEMERWSPRVTEDLFLGEDGLPLAAILERSQEFGSPGPDNGPLRITVRLHFDRYALPEEFDSSTLPSFGEGLGPSGVEPGR